MTEKKLPQVDPRLPLSQETLRLMSASQVKELPHLLTDMQMYAPGRPLSEGVKYVLHVTFDRLLSGDDRTAFEVAHLPDGCFSGTIMGKPATVFFFMPLFE